MCPIFTASESKSEQRTESACCEVLYCLRELFHQKFLHNLRIPSSLCRFHSLTYQILKGSHFTSLIFGYYACIIGDDLLYGRNKVCGIALLEQTMLFGMFLH